MKRSDWKDFPARLAEVHERLSRDLPSGCSLSITVRPKEDGYYPYMAFITHKPSGLAVSMGGNTPDDAVNYCLAQYDGRVRSLRRKKGGAE